MKFIKVNTVLYLYSIGTLHNISDICTKVNDVADN